MKSSLQSRDEELVERKTIQSKYFAVIDAFSIPKYLYNFEKKMFQLYCFLLTTIGNRTIIQPYLGIIFQDRYRIEIDIFC